MTLFSNPKRVLLKLSGEFLMGTRDGGICSLVVENLAQQIAHLQKKNLQMAVVVGGGNLFRGLQGLSDGWCRTTSDQMGMMGTIMNGLALKNACQRLSLDVCLLSSIPVPGICEPFTREKGIDALTRGSIVICVAGTGNPYFSTDTASVLRALELDCEALVKGTKVNGVYSADPLTNPDAVFLDVLSYSEAIAKNLHVMDQTAFTLAQENKLPIIVCSMKRKNGLVRVLEGEKPFTRLVPDEKMNLRAESAQ